MSADSWTALFTAVYAFFTAILAVTGVWALVYARRQLSQARESEKVQHLLKFVEQFDKEYPSGEDIASVRQAIDEADLELFRSRRRRMRADAKYFLLLNVMEMIVLPMQMHSRPFREELRPYLNSDLSLLVNEASKLQERREQVSVTPGLPIVEPELSGHSVLEAIAANWQNLKLSNLRIWGED